MCPTVTGVHEVLPPKWKGKKEKRPENTGDVSLRRSRDGGKAAALKKI